MYFIFMVCTDLTTNLFIKTQFLLPNVVLENTSNMYFILAPSLTINFADYCLFLWSALFQYLCNFVLYFTCDKDLPIIGEYTFFSNTWFICRLFNEVFHYYVKYYGTYFPHVALNSFLEQIPVIICSIILSYWHRLTISLISYFVYILMELLSIIALFGTPYFLHVNKTCIYVIIFSLCFSHQFLDSLVIVSEYFSFEKHSATNQVGRSITFFEHGSGTFFHSLACIVFPSSGKVTIMPIFQSSGI